MSLETTKKLRKIEFIYADGKINPVCHCEYDLIILEDGRKISRSKIRENMDSSEAKIMVSDSSIRITPDEIL